MLIETANSNLFEDQFFLQYLDIISKKVKNSDELKSQLDFNIFSLVTEKYHLENLHSDIIYKLLDPNGEHKEDRTFLNIFLNGLLEKKPALFRIGDFEKAKVEREKNRIDITITDENSGFAIIIENKINGAIDQDRQIPNYIAKLMDKGLETKAVVYLTLHGESEPDQTNWEPSHVKELTEKLIKLQAYQYKGSDKDMPMDLLNLWIEKCAKEASKENNREIFNQYKNLIIKIASKMENNYANKFMFDTFLGDTVYLKKSLDFYSSMESFPQYLANEISNKYAKFKLGINSAAIPPFKFDGTKIVCVLTIELKDKKDFIYQLRIWDLNYEAHGINKVKVFLRNIMDEYKLFENDNNEISRTFSFPTDLKELHNCLGAIIAQLEKNNTFEQ